MSGRGCVHGRRRRPPARGARTSCPGQAYDRSMPLITVSDAPVRDAAADVLILPLVPGADEAPATVPGSPVISQAIAGLDATAGRGANPSIHSSGMVAANSLLLVWIGSEGLP